MNRLKPLFITALLVSIANFSMGTVSARDSKKDLGHWDNLKSLKKGQEIRVETQELECGRAEFESFDEGGITVRSKKGDLTINRKNVFRVSQMSGHNHRMRNTLIGAAIG